MLRPVLAGFSHSYDKLTASPLVIRHWLQQQALSTRILLWLVHPTEQQGGANQCLSFFLCCKLFSSCCAASLRMQSDPANKDFKGISPERAYADFVLAGMVLFLAAWNYIG